MNKLHAGNDTAVNTRSILGSCRGVRTSGKFRCGRFARGLIAAISTWIGLAAPAAIAQNVTAGHGDAVTIQGTVFTSAGKPVSEALVRLEQESPAVAALTRTNTAGAFEFSRLRVGSYTVSAEKSGLRSPASAVTELSPGGKHTVDLVLEDSRAVQPAPSASAPSTAQPMEFADKPNFTIAGVTDWTAAGGHGSDSSLRTSEALVREALSLKPENPATGPATSLTDENGAHESEGELREVVARDPGAYKANRQLGLFYLRAGKYSEAIPMLETAYHLNPADHQNEYDLAMACKDGGDLSRARQHVKELLAHGETSEWHSLAGELDEKLGDPLSAVHEYEQAALLSPNEITYFEWGSELLLHRAVWQAQEVFQKGVRAYPQSSRMLTALGTALFAGARYDEAALRFCEASDLNPAGSEPYLFMGKIEIAAPNPLTCVEKKLARFVELEPTNALANYFYAMALWKGQGDKADEQVLGQVESLLTKAVTIDANCGDAYLQLGILSSHQLNYEKAIAFYKKAIEANPQLAEAHYRLGVAYDRAGERDKARMEFQLHDEIKKQQAAAVEQQRREVKQFMVDVPGPTTSPLPH